MVVFRQEWLYSGKVVVFEQKWLYSCKVVVFGQNGLYSNKARFKRRIFHASNIIHELSAWKMRRLKQLNSADLNYVRLVSHIRQRQSNIREKFDCGFRRRISHAANKMHKLYLLARLPSNRFFFWMVDSNAMRRNSSSVHHGVY